MYYTFGIGFILLRYTANEILTANTPILRDDDDSNSEACKFLSHLWQNKEEQKTEMKMMLGMYTTV